MEMERSGFGEHRGGLGELREVEGGESGLDLLYERIIYFQSTKYYVLVYNVCIFIKV